VVGPGKEVASTEAAEIQALAASKDFPVGVLSEFSSVGPTAKAWKIRRGHTMRTHTLTSICGGLIFAAVITVIGFEGIATARPDAGSSVQIVNRMQKGDRLPLVQINAPRVPVYDSRLPDGCDSLVSPLTHSHLARIAGRCVS
jgi:hypothetical protein